jgi:hypothetical protein
MAMAYAIMPRMEMPAAEPGLRLHTRSTQKATPLDHLAVILDPENEGIFQIFEVIYKGIPVAPKPPRRRMH